MHFVDFFYGGAKSSCTSRKKTDKVNPTMGLLDAIELVKSMAVLDFISSCRVDLYFLFFV